MPLWLLTDVDCEFESMRLGYKYSAVPGDPGLTKGVPHLLDFFHKHGVKASFHLQEQSDPNFSILTKYPELYNMIAEYKQEISLHVHVKEEDYRSRRREIGAAVERLKERGYQISTFRAGWYFSNENTIRVLEEFGIKYDCSPFKNLAVGPVSWFGIPDSPYHPDYKDISRVGSAATLMIPITNHRLGMAISRGAAGELERMKEGVRALASISQEMEQPVVVYFTTHCWKPIEVNSTAFRDWEIKMREDFFSYLLSFDPETLTIGEAGSRWEQSGFSSYYLRLPDLVGRGLPVYRPSRYLWYSKLAVPTVTYLKYKIRGRF